MRVHPIASRQRIESPVTSLSSKGGPGLPKDETVAAHSWDFRHRSKRWQQSQSESSNRPSSSATQKRSGECLETGGLKKSILHVRATLPVNDTPKPSLRRIKETTSSSAKSRFICFHSARFRVINSPNSEKSNSRYGMVTSTKLNDTQNDLQTSDSFKPLGVVGQGLCDGPASSAMRLGLTSARTNHPAAVLRQGLCKNTRFGRQFQNTSLNSLTTVSR